MKDSQDMIKAFQKKQEAFKKTSTPYPQTIDKTNITPEIGMKVTVNGYSDRTVYDIINMSKTTLTLRERKAILVTPPVMQAGGFGGIVLERAEWKTEEDLNGHVIKATYRKDDKCYMQVGTKWNYRGSGIARLDTDQYFYDYEF